MSPDGLTQPSDQMDRRQDPDRRAAPRGGRRVKDHDLVTAADVLALARQEEFVALEVLARALQVSRKTLLRDWESRRLPTTAVGRRVWLASSLVLRAYFGHVESGHP